MHKIQLKHSNNVVNRGVVVDSQGVPLIVNNDKFSLERHISPDDPVFSGHYPHFPIYPGVLLLDLMQSAARSYLEGRLGTRVELRHISRISFQRPVFPNMVISITGKYEKISIAGFDVRVRAEMRQTIATARFCFKESAHAD